MWLQAMLEFGQAEIAEFASESARLAQAVGSQPPVVDSADIARPQLVAARRAISRGSLPALARALPALRREQWRIHDNQADWCWGLLTVFHRQLGEERMEEVYRKTIEPWFVTRYESLRGLGQQESFELAIEGMRAHFCGPSDATQVEVEDKSDRWVMSFDPCGSGGRMRRGDPIRGQRPRTGPPYNFGSAVGAHDWTWGEKGVCLYCAHCSFVNEILPIELTGIPMRVTEYPKEPGQKCRWTVYKSAEQIPESAFTRVGKRKRGPE